jgi:hypothetical protein
MRKRTRKLALHRETLRRLERMDLTRAVGKVGETFEIQTTCACTCTCDTCAWTCGTCNGCGGTDTCRCTQEIETTCVC